MTLETDILEALRTSHVTHQTILAEIAKLKGETDALRRSAAGLEREVAVLEAAAVDIVEPSVVQPMIDDLMGHVEAMRVALGRPDATPAEAVAPLMASATSAQDAPAAPENVSAATEPGSAPRPRSSARAWRTPDAAAEAPEAVPAAPTSRPSRFGFRSG